MPTIYPDEQTMRRRKIHYILDENDDLMWSGPKMGAAFEFLYENGYADFNIKLEAGTFKVTIVRIGN